MYISRTRAYGSHCAKFLFGEHRLLSKVNAVWNLSGLVHSSFTSEFSRETYRAVLLYILERYLSRCKTRRPFQWPLERRLRCVDNFLQIEKFLGENGREFGTGC
jgi:hypothetical protein